MHIASSISVQYPQLDTGKKRIPNVNQQQVPKDASAWGPKRKRRIDHRSVPLRQHSVWHLTV